MSVKITTSGLYIRNDDGNLEPIGTMSGKELTSDMVTSVNGKIGQVSLASDDIGALSNGDIDELTTTAKTVVGAINEINSIISGIDASIASLEEVVG